MTWTVPEVRERVISDATYHALSELRRFRHFKRYYFAFDYDLGAVGAGPLQVPDLPHPGAHRVGGVLGLSPAPRKGRARISAAVAARRGGAGPPPPSAPPVAYQMPRSGPKSLRGAAGIRKIGLLGYIMKPISHTLIWVWLALRRAR